MIAEHTHIPASRESPYPAGGELPRWYYGTLDSFVTLAAAAAVTSKIELFSGVTLLIQRDPIITAKEAASIDLISGGRFVFGVGAGWNIEELRHHGTDPKTRGALLDERIEAIKALWTTEPAEYHGKYVDFDPSYSRPKPVQKPHPPIFIGGDSDATVKRVIRHDAGWISNPLTVEASDQTYRSDPRRRRPQRPARDVRYARWTRTTGAPPRTSGSTGGTPTADSAARRITSVARRIRRVGRRVPRLEPLRCRRLGANLVGVVAVQSAVVFAAPERGFPLDWSKRRSRHRLSLVIGAYCANPPNPELNAIANTPQAFWVDPYPAARR